MKHIKFRQYLLILLFLGLLLFPMLNRKNFLLKDSENTENREPAPKPELTMKNLDPFPLQYEKFYNDHFSLRQTLMKSYYDLNLLVYRKTPIPDQVVLGKNNWLFLGGNEVDVYTGKNRFTNEELNILKKELEYRQNYLAKQGIKFYFVIAPVKATVYGENMPENILKLHEESGGKQLLRYLKQNSTISCIDLYAIMNSCKKSGLLYFKNDNHWTKRGAFIGAMQIVKTIQHDFPTLNVLALDSMRINSTITTSGNLTAMLSKTKLFVDTIIELTPKNGFYTNEVSKVGYPVVKGFPYPWEFEMVRERKDTTMPKLLLISDSFGGNLFPYISEPFSRSVKIFDSWQYKLNEEIVIAEKPDVVVLIV
ncbi:MAG TPA: hypothetical protein PLM70_06680, partial [Bacteroidales bacterium]|nr:hypothetical protein [Bacteroidales bacterium]